MYPVGGGLRDFPGPFAFRGNVFWPHSSLGYLISSAYTDAMYYANGPRAALMTGVAMRLVLKQAETLSAIWAA